MSSTFVADTTDENKSDNTLIIIVNNDGTVTVDPDTLQNLIENQPTGPVSVVRVASSSQGDENSQDSNSTCDSQGDGSTHVNLTVEGFYAPPEPQTPATEGPLAAASDPPLDPFLEMDPEQLQRLETALQSEQAKQILGENVTAMLDMLSVEEDSSKLTETIRMDHCYTNLSPSSAPSVPPSISTPTTTVPDVESPINNVVLELQKVVPSSRGTARGTRGRGRGPGRPRKDVSATRSLSYRGTGVGRGLGRGAVAKSETASNMVMMQQIKHITPPPPNSPSASLVPLIRPLVLPTDRNTTVHIGQGLTFTQKQGVPVTPGGSRLVSLASKARGSLSGGGQQRVIVTNNTAVPLHELNLPATDSTVQITERNSVSVANAGVLVTGSSAGTTSGNPPSQVTSSTLHSNTGQAKVLVAKMPSIPPQLLGAQPIVADSEVHKIPLKNSSEDDDEEFANFPRDEESDEESDEEDEDTDDEYRGPVGGRQRGAGRGGRPWRGRGGRGRRAVGRGSERRRGTRGGSRRRGVGRFGRAGSRPEDVERVHKLDSEMAAALAAMDKPRDSFDPVKVVPQNEHTSDMVVTGRDNSEGKATDSTVESSMVSKTSKPGTKVTVKRKSESGDDEATSKSPETAEGKNEPVKPASPIEVKDVKIPTKTTTTKEQHQERTTPLSPVRTTVVEPKPDVRKNYPKRENRKPPAHLAEALGPALFSTPDIIRRVSTGSEQKVTTSSDSKKDDNSGSSKRVEEPVSQELPSSTVEEKGDHIPANTHASAEKRTEIKGSSEDISSKVKSPETEKEQINKTTTLAQNTSIDTEKGASQKVIQQEADSISKVVPSPIPESDSVKEAPQQAVTKQVETGTLSKAEPERSVPTRPVRKRNAPVQPDFLSTDIIDAVTRKQPSQTQVRERKKSDDSRNNQVKSRGRRRSSEAKVETDEEDNGSSDAASLNSEDDPDRLWCICKKPHNNRFMICCDVCEDWFHGKCVGITKAMGQQMENKGLEWSCPNCSKKVEPAAKTFEKDIKKRFVKDSRKAIIADDQRVQSPRPSSPRTEIGKEARNPKRGKDSSLTQSAEIEKNSKEGVQQVSSSAESATVMFCIVCKKEARQSSIYCSDACILKHAQESLQDKNATGSGSVTKPNQQSGTNKSVHSQPTQQLLKTRSERVNVYERKTGRLLTGTNAPTVANLKSWLKENPTFEVVKSSDVPDKITGKQTSHLQRTNTQQHLQQQQQPQEQQHHQQQQQQQQSLQQQKIQTFQQKQNQLQTKTLQPKNINQPSQQSAAVTEKTSVSQPKAGSQQKVSVAQQKQPLSPLKISIKSSDPVAPNKPPTPGVSPKMKTQKQAILIPPDVLYKMGNKTPAKSAGGSGKTELSPTNKGQQQHAIKQTSVVSKVPATSTVKDTEKAPSKKIDSKRSSTEPSKKDEEKDKEKEKEKEKEKPAGPEPIRLNVRKTLQELLLSRIKECSDLQVTEDEVQKIALNIEEEMHSYFRDTGIKYKSKYRSLVFNIKDPKNLTLFRKIADKSVTPHQLVRLSPEELASQELAQWREREAKHQIEMIKKNELDMMSLAKTYVLKTHKGEQIIETDETLKPEVPDLVDPSAVPDLISQSNNSVSSTVEDGKLETNGKEKLKDKSKDKDIKNKDKSKKEAKEYDSEKTKHDDKKNKEKTDKSRKDDKESSKRERHHHHHHHSSSRSDREKRHSSRDHKEKHRSEKHKHDSDKHRENASDNMKKERKENENIKTDKLVKKEDIYEETNTDPVTKNEKSITSVMEDKVGPEVEEDSLAKVETIIKQDPLEHSDASDNEPSSTVTIKTPDITTTADVLGSTLWKGFVNMPDVAKFFTTVQVVSGDIENLEFPDIIDIVGRILPDTVWDYISKMKKTGTKEIQVIRFTAANDEEKLPYITLYSYLSARNRMGVVGNISRTIKDFYIMPLPSHSPVPQVLLPLDGPGFEDYRPHLLLGILVRTKRKRLAVENQYIAKVPKRVSSGGVAVTERSYTPPLPSTGSDAGGSLTPPHPPPSVSDSYTPPLSPTQSMYSGSRHHSGSRSKWSDDGDSEKESSDEGMMNAIELTDVAKPELCGVKKSGSPYSVDNDDDAPYSPGENDEYVGESSEDNLLSPPKNSSELQRKMEEINRKIEEQKQQIQSISSAIGSDGAAAAAASSDSKNVQIAQGYSLRSGDKSIDAVPSAADENEAYSPSRSFTPPPTIPFMGASEGPSMLSSLPSNLSIPSNLHEILASIKKRESDVPALLGSKVIDLKSDPIVQHYGNTGQEVDSSVVGDDVGESSQTSSTNKTYPDNTAQSSHLVQSASSAVPALLSLSTPVVHPHSAASQTTDTRSRRDPRQRPVSAPDILSKPSSSTLSKLSDDDLIKKAAEMMEIEHKDSSDLTPKAVYPQPVPPVVDSLPSVHGTSVSQNTSASSVGNPIPTAQPLPPGVEDEDYQYSPPFVPPLPSAPGPSTHNIPMPPTAPPVPTPPKFSSSRSTPVPYVAPRRYTPPPPPAYSLPRSKDPSYGSKFPAAYGDVKNEIKDSESGLPPRRKRKFRDVSDRTDVKRGRSRSPLPSGRDMWDNEAPVSVAVRGRYNVRGRGGFLRGVPRGGGRGFMRPKGRGMGPGRGRWRGHLPTNDKRYNRRRSPRYDASIRSEWDMHIKDFEEKHRERTRELRYREQERLRDRPGRSSRSSRRTRGNDSSDSS